MKFKVDIECTPEEARAFLGLPDVKPMQDAVISKWKRKLEEAVGASDAQDVLKAWASGGAGKAVMEGFEALQKAFWAKASGVAGANDTPNDDDKKPGE